MTFRAGFTLVLILLSSVASMARAEEASDAEEPSDIIEWRDRTVDLYVDARLRHDATVLRSADALAVLVPGSDEAWILTAGEEEDADAGVVRAVPSNSFTWAEPLVATSSPDVREGDEVGTWIGVDGGWFAKTAEVALLALPHQGPAGEIEADELWRAVPSWKRLKEAWRPDPDGDQDGKGKGEVEAMKVLAGLPEGIHFEAVFGTWCGDSRRSVPKLLAAAEELGLDVSLVAIRRGFTEPLHYARDHRVTNVPTILVKRGDLEIGRFVERPRSASVITDLAAILQRRPVPPPDAFSADDVLVARGEYALRSADGAEIGRETWSLFRTDQGHTRLGSRRVADSGAVTELWQRWTPADDGGRTGFVEITRDARGERSRTRLYRRAAGDDAKGNDSVHALTRGDAGGIVEQDLAVPSDAVVIAPGVAASGLAWQAAGRPESATLNAVVVPGAGDGFASRQDASELKHVARVELYDPALGDIAADHVILRRAGARPATHEWWIHADLGVPVRAMLDSVTAELLWLEFEPAR